MKRGIALKGDCDTGLSQTNKARTYSRRPHNEPAQPVAVPNRAELRVSTTARTVDTCPTALRLQLSSC